MQDNYDNGPFTDDHRPNLQPVDPRATASGNPEFKIHGSIDNENCTDISTGKPYPSAH